MARIKYTALVESISGSIAGTTFQRNAYGFSIKRKPNMVRPARAGQVRTQFVASAQSRKWGTLSSANRAAWNAYAASFPIPSRLNPDSELNGFNYFQKYHNIRNMPEGDALLADPGATAPNIEILDIYTYLDNLDSELYVYVQITNSGNDLVYNIYMTPPISPGKSVIPTTPLFVASGSSPGDIDKEVTIGYLNAFGKLPASGDRVGIGVKIVREDVGMIFIIPAAIYTIFST